MSDMQIKSLNVFTDGGARGNPGPAGIGIQALDAVTQKVIYEHKAFLGTQTNNVAEYTAVVTALEWLSRFCSTQALETVNFYLDSKLVVEQVNKNWKVKQEHLQPLWQNIQDLISQLPCSVNFSYVPRAQNSEADRLVNEALNEANV